MGVAEWSLLMFVLLFGSAKCEDQMMVYEYHPPEKYESTYGLKSDLMAEESTNEVHDNEIPQVTTTNFTTEEYAFTLFSWNHRNGIMISENNTIEELNMLIDPTLDVKIVVHGWLSSANSYVVNNTIKEYLATRNLNAVAVDWSSLAGLKFYPVTTYSVAPVGRGVAKLVLRLLEAKVTTLEQVHLIGHSLGAHVMGVAGNKIFKSAGGKVSRITGLDPASPLFEYVSKYDSSRLDPSDAEFVDVVHTAGGAAGYFGTLGHADFYPNGGTPIQPGCAEMSLSVVGCSHGMAYRYYDESISNPKGFRAVECPNWSSFSNGSCDNNPTAFMGDACSPSTRGVFYLETNAEPPYAKG